jgi:hypothetical protein
MAFAEFLVNPDLLNEILHNSLLIPVDPASSEYDEESQIV